VFVNKELIMATSTFGKAFREARAAGEKTFTFNGKKYTTELAKPKKAQESSEYQKMSPAESEAAMHRFSGTKPAEQASVRAVDNETVRPRYSPLNSPENPDATSETFKRGGKVKASSASKRADGIAQRGKTRGRMV